MTRSERRLFRRTLALGLVLTTLVIIADAVGLITPFERILYDVRARRFQHFNKPPTDRIVHLDIDDSSVQPDALGRYPWHRTKLAEIVDELHLAGAKVIGFDVIFPEPEDLRYENLGEGRFKEIDDDQNLAQAIRRAGNVLVPFSATLIDEGGKKPPTAGRDKAIERLLQFSQPMPAGLPPLLHAEDELTTILPISEAARYSGIVDFLPSADSIVRSVPLFINYRGRLMPHMELAAVCAMLDVPLDKLRVEPDRVTIPVADGAPIIVPVRTIHSDTFGDVGMFMDVPWFGKGGDRNWETMYDYPSHIDKKQHIPLRNVWAIRQGLHELDQNRQVVDDAIERVQSLFPSSEAAQFLATPAPGREWSERARIIASFLDSLKGVGVADMAASKPANLKEDEQALISAYEAFQTVSKLYSDVQKARHTLHQQLNDRYALLGWTATGLTDNYSTSIEPQSPGVMMHGAMFNAIINRDFWTTSPWWVGAMFTLVLGGLTTLSVASLSVYRALLATALIVAGYALLNGLVLFDYGNHIVAAAPPIEVAVLIWFGVTVGRIIYEQRERSRITRRFSDYTDPAIVDLVVDNPELAHFEGQVREISVVFTDLAGFTSMSEKLRERTVPLLNKYMSLMLPIIRESGGYWNKFLGDGIMFFYNAPGDDPEHAAKAIRAVLQMREAMIPFNDDLRNQGLPSLAMRAGIATGMMIVGDAGSTEGKERAHDYTVLGDEVNLGARLESANKVLGSNILINARTAELAKDQVLLRPMGRIQVVGKTEGVPVFEALCLHSEATDRHKALVELSTEVVEHFRASRFDACIEAASRLGPGRFTELYTELAQKYRVEPPAGRFDGQIVLSAK